MDVGVVTIDIKVNYAAVFPSLAFGYKKKSSKFAVAK